MKYTLGERNYRVDIECDGHSAYISGGEFCGIFFAKSPIFSAVVERLTDKEEFSVDSLSRFERVESDGKRTVFYSPEGYRNITFIISHECDENGISWYVDVENDSEEYSVISVNYPIPTVYADTFNMFFPSCSGRVIKDVGRVGFKQRDTYPHHYSSMQYFAYYAEKGGIYLGIHDKDACMKVFDAVAENGRADLAVLFHAIGAGNKKNSFSLGGYIRWQVFLGDWYDATSIYRDFVYKYAKWLPEITENGREDIPDTLKEIPYWIVEYMPNSPEQRDVRPKKLGAVSHLYGKDYWFDAPLELQKKLGTPIGYHVYNWHNNPFNINYPHFTPKDEFFRGFEKLKGSGIRVMPYINGVSWEINDADEGFEINFENTGKYGAALNKWGEPFECVYPQKKVNGEDTKLAPMCPSYPTWRKIVDDLARMLENDVGVDGIYFDEIAAHTPHPCRNELHGHKAGGGSYWTDGYNELMDTVKKKKKDGVFYVSESSGEPYMKSFDGYLTWLWRQDDDVPAFSAIYAGYIVMLGRFSDGIDKNDDGFFRRNIAKGLLYGQQMGWLFADIVYNEERTAYLKNFVTMRYKHTDTFNTSYMLRPPKVYGADEGILYAAGWKKRDGSSVTLFVANAGNTDRDYEISFDNREYGVDESSLPDGSTVIGTNIIVKGKIKASSCVDIAIKTKK